MQEEIVHKRCESPTWVAQWMAFFFSLTLVALIEPELGLTVSLVFAIEQANEIARTNDKGTDDGDKYVTSIDVV